MLKELFAVCLLVDNFEESLDFYKNKIGLELNSLDNKFADFKLNGTSLAIFQKKEAVLMFPKKYMNSGGGCVLAFQVENLKESLEMLKSRGVEIFEGPKTTEWGQELAYFLDPDNNIWEMSAK